MGDASVHADDQQSSSSRDSELPWPSRAWSVQTVIALLCLFCILATAVSTEVMGTIACDSGLDDTRSTMDASTSALNEVAQHSLTRVSSELMVYIASGATRTLDKHLQAAMQDTARIRGLVLNNLADVRKDNYGFITAAAEKLWLLLSTVVDGSPTVTMFISAGDYALGFAITHRTNDGQFAATDISGFFFSPNETIYASTHRVSGLALRGDPRYPVVPLPTPLRELGFIKMPRSGLVPMNGTVFPHIVPYGNFLGYMITSVLPDPTGSVPQVETGVNFRLTELRQLLGEVTASAGRVNSSAIMRAFSTVATTWLADRMKDAGDEGWEKEDQEGLLTGVSHGESVIEFYGLDPFTNYVRNLSVPRPATNATDPYIKAVAIGIQGNYHDFYKKPHILEVVVNGTVLQDHIVSCDRLTYPQHGLDWWITVSIDAESVLGDVQRQSAEVGAEIEAEKGKVADKIALQKYISRSIIIGIAVGLVVLSAVTSFIILRPIKALQQKMELVAGMQLDNMETESTSTFYELRRMQRDFRKMVHNLLEFRAYVPSSVLESNGYSGEGGRQVVEPPTGKVAIVFTDIKGSTNLWKLSPGDMNVAMEVHNEVIREACVEHSGYEVKTIGDSFMVSFRRPTPALSFALDVQTNLAKRVWPSGLELPPAGLVVRIGVNYGPTIAEENPVTGRVDYRGNTVNLASRVEGKARPGTVSITSDMYAAIRWDMGRLGNPILTSDGVHEIRGLEGGHELFTLVPRQLRHRLSESETDTEHRGAVRPTPDAAAGERVDTASSFAVQVSRRANGTALQIAKTHATVAVCRLVHDGRDNVLFDNCNIMVRAAVEAAHATDGVISNVTGCSLSVLWNASKRCLMHTTAALSFASEMKKLQRIMQVGLATGLVQHGNVGTRTSRFATTFGVPLDAAEAMTEHAQRLGVYCLHADCSHDKRLQADVTVRSCLRLVDAWLDERHERPIHIYEVHLDSLERAIQAWSLQDDAGRSGLEQHSNIVQAAMESSEGLARLKTLACDNAQDTVLAKVLTMMSTKAPTNGHRCTVRFSHYTEC